MSSAKPAISGNAPDFLKSWSVGVYKEPPYIFQRSATLARKHLPIPTAMSSQRSDPINQLIQRGEAYTMQNLSASSNDMRFVASTVQSDMTSATFIIPSLATIPSDNEVHKVTSKYILEVFYNYYSCVNRFKTYFFILFLSEVISIFILKSMN